jgi:hypothetical protein
VSTRLNGITPRQPISKLENPQNIKAGTATPTLTLENELKPGATSERTGKHAAEVQLAVLAPNYASVQSYITGGDSRHIPRLERLNCLNQAFTTHCCAGRTLAESCEIRMKITSPELGKQLQLLS